MTAYDAYGNVATGYTGTVALSSSDPHAVLPANYTFTGSDAGKHSFTVTLETSGTQSITATDTATSSLTATETGIAVQAAAAKTLTVTGFPTSDTAGTAGNVTVTAYDAYGNVATSYTGTVVLSSSDPHAVLPASYTFTGTDAGKHSFAVTLDTSGTQSITASDTATSSITGTETGISVGRGCGEDSHGHRFSDQRHGGHSRDRGGDGLRRLWQRGDRLHRHGSSLQQRPACGAASELYIYRDRRRQAQLCSHAGYVGHRSRSRRATQRHRASRAPRPAFPWPRLRRRRLTISGFPTTDTAGTAGTVTVTAYDAYGNVATGYTGTVALTSSDPHAVLPANYTFTGTDAGKHSFTVTLDTSGTESITASDTATSSLTGTETGIAVQAAAAKTFTVTGFPSSDTAGTAGTVTVTAYDAYGNVATGYTGTVALTSTDPHAVLPASYTFTGTDAGKHSFAVTLDTSGTQSITASDTTTSSITGHRVGIPWPRRRRGRSRSPVFRPAIRRAPPGTWR